MKIFVGIDPSINSTGVTVLAYNENDIEIFSHFYIIKENKLTKREQIIQEELLNFDFCLYNKFEHKNAKDNHESEYFKTMNFIQICDFIINIISDTYKSVNNKNEIIQIIVVQEGISYGSMATKSVFDLAGLNFMIRQKVMTSNYEFSDNLDFIIATPAEIKKFATGNGNANKMMMINLFSQIHPEIKLKKIDDVCDSYFMAKYAKSMLKSV